MKSLFHETKQFNIPEKNVPSKTCLTWVSQVIVVEMFFNFVFVLSFGYFDGSPEIVTGLFPIVSVSGFKGRCPL